MLHMASTVSSTPPLTIKKSRKTNKIKEEFQLLTVKTSANITGPTWFLLSSHFSISTCLGFNYKHQKRPKNVIHAGTIPVCSAILIIFLIIAQ